MPREDLRTIAEGLTTWPADFAVHPKVGKLLEQRAEMAGVPPPGLRDGRGARVRQPPPGGHPDPVERQDSERGTFSQRHAVLVDTRTEQKYMPLAQVGADLARCEIYNSPLSEAAVLAFEYGSAATTQKRWCSGKPSSAISPTARR